MLPNKPERKIDLTSMIEEQIQNFDLHDGVYLVSVSNDITNDLNLIFCEIYNLGDLRQIDDDRQIINKTQIINTIDDIFF